LARVKSEKLAFIYTLRFIHKTVVVCHAKKKTNTHLAHLQSHTSQNTTHALQKSQISSPTRIPIFASILIYRRFFDFQYLPEFRSFGKNWILNAKNHRE
tara:strand:- start:3479 stop:3775 length:297 start_codon:yes stop_codon:yes gene_type:complete